MKRRSRGNYYATTTTRRAGGVRFGHQTARQARTLAEACRTVDDFEHPEWTGRGYVQLWDESSHRRLIVAERDEAGNWWSISPYDGTLRALEVDDKEARR
jgi:hypothetical protein